MMKKLLSVLLVCCLAFSMLAGCGRATDNDDDEPRNKASDRDDRDDDTSDDEETGKTSETIVVEWDDLDIDEDFDVDIGDDNTDTQPASSDFTITIDPPEGWTEEAAAGSALLNYQKVDEETFDVCIFTVYEGYAYGKDTAAEVAEYNAASIKEYYEDAEFSEIKSMTIDGLDAARFDILMTFGSFEQIQVYVYFIKDGQVFMAQGAYMPDDEQGAKDIEAILDSIEVE